MNDSIVSVPRDNTSINDESKQPAGDEKQKQQKTINEAKECVTNISHDHDVRDWFNNLLTGEDKAAAMAIADKAFIGMFTDYIFGSLERKEDHGNMKQRPLPYHEDKPVVGTIAMKSISLGDLASMYDAYVPRSHDFIQETTPVSSSEMKKYETLNGPPKTTPADHETPIEPMEPIDSISFRIRNEGVDVEELTEVIAEEKTKDANEEEEVTTLHFKSGLSLPISTKTETNKKLIANNGKKMKEVNPSTVTQVDYSKVIHDDGHDVHQHTNFTALSSFSRVKNSSPHSESKRKKAQRIAESKQSASRAMLATCTNTEKVVDELLRNIRVIFTSALSLKNESESEKNTTNDNDGIQLLTLDPSYLEKRDGSTLAFFNDVQKIIESQTKNNCNNKSNNDSKIGDKNLSYLESKALTENLLESSDSTWPLWFQNLIQNETSSISMLLVLLAKFELSIRESHRHSMNREKPIIGTGPGFDDSASHPNHQNCSNADDVSSCQVFFTPPETEESDSTCVVSIDSLSSTVNAEVYDVTLSQKKLDISRALIRERLSSPRSFFTFDVSYTDLIETCFKDILLIRSHLKNLNEGSESAVANIKASLLKKVTSFNSDCIYNVLTTNLPSIKLEDLILVPLTSMHIFSRDKVAPVLSPLADDNTKTWKAIVKSCVDLIMEAAVAVGSIRGNDKSDIKQDDLNDTQPNIDEVCSLFNDEILAPNNNKCKKKKKKKKKKRKGNSSLTEAAKLDQVDISPDQKSNSSLYRDESESINVNTVKINGSTHIEVDVKVEERVPEENADCAESVASVISDVTSKAPVKDPNPQVSSNTSNVNGDVMRLNNDITLSRLDGLNSTCVVGSGRIEDETDTNEVWETVISKASRNQNKNKKGSNVDKATNDSSSNIARTSSPSNGRKKREKSKQSRQRSSNRRKAKDATNVNLDLVTEETSKEKQISSNEPKSCSSEKNDISSKNSSKVFSLRDVVLGNLQSQGISSKAWRLQQTQSTTVKISSNNTAQNPTSSIVDNDDQKTIAIKSSTEDNSKVNNRQNKNGAVVADQSTAQTIQETLSGVSANSFSNTEPAGKASLITTGHTSSIMKTHQTTPKLSMATSLGTDIEAANLSCEDGDGVEPVRLKKTHFPPVQTLIGPGNTYSATSSVASSLEAPHGVRHRPHRHTSFSKEAKEDDVGYHLLKVCERLSEDMNIFMGRRSVALNNRRRERGALLSALQDTVGNIWPAMCHVEMYGSCATKLDLPSSDLDVVVCGLDRIVDKNSQSLKHQRKGNRKQGLPEEDITGSKQRKGNRKSVTIDNDHQNNDSDNFNSYIPRNSNNYGYMGYPVNQFYQPLSVNGSRVLRLSSELEGQPWAVQVKAIPTASVPVLKILADPSRLPGAVGDMDWMMQQQRWASSGHDPNDSHAGPSHYMSSPPWRGADVMNGLLSLDITFEGPEHGGLGSTAFSGQVVQQACNETHLPPESTPAVQVIMVIKELLAQRRLNEPFSGGLSSYAILLLVVAVMKERQAIREEMARVERQRMAVASESSSNFSTSSADMKQNDSERHISKTIPSLPTSNTQESCFLIPPASNTNCQADEKLSPVLDATVTSSSSSESNQIQHQPFMKSSWATVAMKTSNVIQASIEKNDDDPQVVDSSDESVKSITENKDSSQNRAEDTISPIKVSRETTTLQTDLNHSCYCSLFDQGSNDVIEVLCSGEPTAGKLLMHFLHFYGKHFDSQTTCIDVRGTHHPEYIKYAHDSNALPPPYYNPLSPFIPRQAGGAYNPITEVYTVDPIVVYDPLEGEESNNVARSCYAWSSICWVFEQCYNTLSGVVERGAGTNSDRNRREANMNRSFNNRSGESKYIGGVPGPVPDAPQGVDEMSPLLELLLSF